MTAPSGGPAASGNAAPAAGAMAAGGATMAGDTARALAARTCDLLAARLDAIPGSGPALLRSYDDASGQGPMAEPALARTAFTYDNALAAIALAACGRAAHALRVGEALLAATQADRAGAAGRLRNAYREGAQAERPVPPAGWWDARAGRWLEDAHQVGSATGNVAWAALALLTLHEATGQARFRDGAARLAAWAVEHARDTRGPGGFAGGVQGFDDAPRRLGWKSTEHNVDLVAVFDWLERVDAPGAARNAGGAPRKVGVGGAPHDAPGVPGVPGKAGAAGASDPRAALGGWAAQARAARAFLQAMWDAPGGRFLVGTLPDGVTVNRAVSGLDAQLWPLLLREAPASWQAALRHAERAHGVAGGFDFNDDRDGVWVEGTAQAALAYRAVGRAQDAARLLAQLAHDASPGGYLWATRQPRITTGLALGPDSATDDFHYYRRPHLGATAWAALAALGWNPFTGRRLP